MKKTKYSLTTAVAIVVAAMIGTGVFTSLYFQIDSVPSGSGLLLLWLAGGVVALCGGLCYAELVGYFPRSGGEYQYLTRIYHPALGFSAGVCTLVVGFAAPMAGIALNLGNYLCPILNVPPDSVVSRTVAVVSVVFITVVHYISPDAGSRFQNISTFFKLLLIVVFVALPWVVTDVKPSGVSFEVNAQTFDLVASGSFFSCLALLYYTYTGWNTSIYMASDIENPERNLPFSILFGVALVTLVYLLLNFVFLYVCSFDELKAGGTSVGNTFITKLFGNATWAGVRVLDVFSALLSFALLATLNAYTIASYRVAEVFGSDYPALGFLAKKNGGQVPHLAILGTGSITLLFVVVSDIKSLLDYIGFALSAFGSLAVFGLMLTRWRNPRANRPFKTWGYPITPLIFLGINAAMVYFSVKTLYGGHFFYSTNTAGDIELSPLSASFLTIFLGMVLYYILPQQQKRVR